MIESLYLSWILTVLFAATGLWFLIRCVRSIAGTPVPRRTAMVSCAACAVMSVAMIGMSWSWGARLPVWPQVAVFALATVWFAVLATCSRRPSRSRRPSSSRLPHAHNALMMAAVVWMITTMPASMATGNSASHAMASPMAELPLRETRLTHLSALLAAYFLLAALPWISQAMHAKRQGRACRLDAISHAAMSVGMGTMLLFMT